VHGCSLKPLKASRFIIAYIRIQGSNQLINIFGGVENVCNLLNLTTKHVFENFGESQSTSCSTPVWGPVNVSDLRCFVSATEIALTFFSTLKIIRTQSWKNRNNFKTYRGERVAHFLERWCPGNRRKSGAMQQFQKSLSFPTKLFDLLR